MSQLRAKKTKPYLLDKHLGVDGFFVERKKILDAYDSTKKQNAQDPVHMDQAILRSDNCAVSYAARQLG